LPSILRRVSGILAARGKGGFSPGRDGGKKPMRGGDMEAVELLSLIR